MQNKVRRTKKKLREEKLKIRRTFAKKDIELFYEALPPPAPLFRLRRRRRFFFSPSADTKGEAFAADKEADGIGESDFGEGDSSSSESNCIGALFSTSGASRFTT